MATRHMVLQKYYVYDPNVHAGDELGGLRILEDQDKDGALHVLASPLMIQYWIDQGLLGLATLDDLSDGQKKLLAQITRGRSESDDEPKRVPKYSKQMQSGAPQFAGTLASASGRMKARAKKAKEAKGRDGRPTNRAKSSRQQQKREAPSHPIVGQAPAE
jgi:hypothetical protein